MTQELTNKDRKVLKYEKRIGYVLGGLILCFGGLFNLFYFLLIKSDYNYLLVLFINLGVILLSYLVCRKINLKVNRDLKANTKELLKEKIAEKVEEKSYEAGSGTLYIPGLGDSFPKLWGQKMRETRKYYFVTDSKKYEVEKEVYDNFNENMDFYVHFAKHSYIILDFSKNE